MNQTTKDDSMVMTWLSFLRCWTHRETRWRDRPTRTY